jgi:hypothetical protein
MRRRRAGPNNEAKRRSSLPVTFVAAFHLDSYSLFAAGSRATSIPSSPVDQAFRSLRATPSGLIGGSGLVQITESVGQALEDSPALRPQDMTALMRERHAAVVKDLADNPEDLRAAEQTGWIVAARRRGKLQLQLYHASHTFKAQDVNRGFPMTILPVDVTPEQFSASILKYKKRLRPIKALTSFDESLNYHLDVMHDFLREAQAASQTVGDAMQIGFFRSDGEMEVMDEWIRI